MRSPARLPAAYAVSMSIDGDGEIQEAVPGVHILEVRMPQSVRATREENVFQMVRLAGRRLVAVGCPEQLGASNAVQIHVARESFHGAMRFRRVLLLHLKPDHVSIVELVAFPEHAGAHHL